MKITVTLITIGLTLVSCIPSGEAPGINQTRSSQASIMSADQEKQYDRQREQERNEISLQEYKRRVHQDRIRDSVNMARGFLDILR